MKKSKSTYVEPRAEELIGLIIPLGNIDILPVG